jgi:predicted MPP superfamily phosphohydrolase
MQPAEQLRVTLFLALIVATYVLAFGTVLRAVARRRGAQLDPLPRRSIWLRRIAVVLAIAGLPCFAYGWRIEPYWPEVTRVRLESDKLGPVYRPIRLVHLSDLHSDPRVRLEESLPRLVAALHPDAILFTGDAINSRQGLPVFRRCLTQLARIAPTFAVRGNWDAWYFPDVDLFGGTGAVELGGRPVPLRVGPSTLWLTGLGVGHESRLAATLAALPPDDVSVFLFHYPDLIESVRESTVDLYCAGHTHGGQVALPFYGALVTFSVLGKKYESGLFREGATWMYVNRGIGMEGVRFGARPEITVYEIAPASGVLTASHDGGSLHR